MEGSRKTAAGKAPFDIVRELYDWAQALVGAIILIVLLFAFILSMYTVRGDSMLDTLHPGEMLLISRLFYTPERGDIVIFTLYGDSRAYDEGTGRYEPFVKRVIGLPGDMISFDAREGKILVNGEALDEPYLRDGTTDSGGSLLRPTEGESGKSIEVPPGHLFVMGDNRNNSMDSRSFGMVDQRCLLGRVLLRVTPLSKLGAVS